MNEKANEKLKEAKHLLSPPDIWPVEACTKITEAQALLAEPENPCPWIPVSERLPEEENHPDSVGHSKSVLCYNPDLKACRNANIGGRYWVDIYYLPDDLWMMGLRPTHWMPIVLPAKPCETCRGSGKMPESKVIDGKSTSQNCLHRPECDINTVNHECKCTCDGPKPMPCPKGCPPKAKAKDRAEFVKELRQKAKQQRELYPCGWSSKNGHTLLSISAGDLDRAADFIESMEVE